MVLREWRPSHEKCGLPLEFGVSLVGSHRRVLHVPLHHPISISKKLAAPHLDRVSGHSRDPLHVIAGGIDRIDEYDDVALTGSVDRRKLFPESGDPRAI